MPPHATPRIEAVVQMRPCPGASCRRFDRDPVPGGDATRGRGVRVQFYLWVRRALDEGGQRRVAPLAERLGPEFDLARRGGEAALVTLRVRLGVLLVSRAQ